jgi:hypothetical protein
MKRIKGTYRDGTFKKRQLYLIMASSVMNRPEMKDFFAENFKHDLVHMAKDSVANVRLALARVLRNHFKQIDGSFIYDAKINQALATLAAD